MLNNSSNSSKLNKQPDGIRNNNPWPRAFIYPILETALRVSEFRYARQTALHWLTYYPGDLPIDLIHGQALFAEGHLNQALKVAERLCDRDPEFLGAQELLAQILNKTGNSSVSDSHRIIQALGGKVRADDISSVNMLSNARQALQAKDMTRAEKHIQQAIATESDSPLVALTHLRIISRKKDTPLTAVQSLAHHFHERWPECIQFILLLAESLIDSGDSDQAVALLHQAAAYDVSGQVVERLWGNDHPYVNLWPTRLYAVISSPIPASVASALGWNLLEPGILSETEGKQEDIKFEPILLKNNIAEIEQDPDSNPEKSTLFNFEPKNSDRQPIDSAASFSDIPETLLSVQTELEQVSERLQKPELASADGRFPTYIVFSTRRGLEQKYGRAGFAMLDAAMQELAEVIRCQPEWGATVFYADDPACAAKMGTKPAQAGDAWALKLALADLDDALGKNGAMIGAVLIVGGPKIIPFHNLPNPTDDPDTEVPSDNPYATRDENFFIPEWPVGRLPNEAGKNPAGLLGNLQSITAFHANNTKRSLRWWEKLRGWLSELVRSTRKTGFGSFGYSAEVWRKASLEVFQQIGSPKELVTSPPVEISETAKPTQLNLLGELGYFNLHGLADSGEWYGQRDPINGTPGTDYPVALRTQDVINGGKAPEIIFSEACYGAYIQEKTIENSLALKFLASGCRAVVGSTVMSYGSISTPLNAADLLGIAFWKNLNKGIPVGDALRRAKIHLAREMHKRQGYLDGEDQKTLISFVLYGDPLTQTTNRHTGSEYFYGPKQRKTFLRPQGPPPKVKMVCDRAEVPGISDPIPDEVMIHIKRVVTQYLPGMQGAQVTMSHEHLDCSCEGHNCLTGQMGPKAHPDIKPERRVVTLSKSIPFEEHTHPAYARLTLDKSGKVVKLAVSR